MKKLINFLLLFFSVSAYAAPIAPLNGGTGMSNNNSNTLTLNAPIVLSGSASSALDINSTSKGSRPVPAMTTTQRNAISSPENGLQVFDTTLNNLYVYLSSAWNYFPTDAVAVLTTGSYMDPSWITALAGSKLTGTVTANAIAAGTYNISITGTSAGAPPTGAASGSFFNGTYPNPGVVNNSMTNAQLAQMAANTFKGNNTGSTANAADMTVSQAKTLLNLAGTNSGDVTLTGQSYLTLTGQALTANAVDLSGANATGTLAAARFPAMTGDVTNTEGNLATTLATVNSRVGTFGSASVVPQLTLNAKGLVTNEADVTITPAAIGAPTTTGTGASGTWGISISGSSSTTTTATNATNGATVSTTTNASYFPLFAASSTNSNQPFNLGTGLSFNPSTAILSTTGLNLSGNAIFSGTGQSINLYNSQLINYYTDAGITLKGSLGPGRFNDTTLQNVTGGNWLRLGAASGGKISFWIDGNVGVNDAPNMFLSSSGLNLTTLSVSSLVATDSSKNLISASGSYGISISGTATNATNVATTTTSATSNYYPLFVTSASSANQAANLYGGFSFVPGNGSLTLINSSSQPMNPTATTQLNIANSTQNSARIVLSGQEFYQASNTSTDGVALLSGVNRSGNRQLWIGDSAALTQNSTNKTIRIQPNGGQIDAMATDGSTQLPIQFGQSGATTTISGNAINLSDGDVAANTGNLIISTVDKGIIIKSTAVSAGTANASVVTGVTLAAGAVTFNDNYVTTETVCYFSVTTSGGTPGTAYGVTVGSGTITVKSTSTLDTSTGNVACLKGN